MDKQIFEKQLEKRGFNIFGMMEKSVEQNALVALLVKKEIITGAEFKQACSDERDRIAKKLEQMPDEQD